MSYPLVNIINVHDSPPTLVPDGYGCPTCKMDGHYNRAVIQTYTQVDSTGETVYATCSRGHLYGLSHVATVPGRIGKQWCKTCEVTT